MADRRKASTGAKLCTRCLQPGHRHRECRSSIVCKYCHSDTHHVLLCKSLEEGVKKKADGVTKDKGKKEHSKDGPKKTAVNKTVAQEDEQENSAAESKDSGIGVTVETFFLQKSEKVDRSLTMVATVRLKDGKKIFVQVRSCLTTVRQIAGSSMP
jgi:hypothetical protein